MVITILEAHADSDKAAVLQDAYTKGLDTLPPQMLLIKLSGRSSRFGKAAKRWMKCAIRVKHRLGF
jgi:hypothetical protein